MENSNRKLVDSLDKYKSYLDTGSYEGLRYVEESKSRYVSFKICLEHLQQINNPSVLELGTCRSFVDGRFVGCNSDDVKYWEPNSPDKWDWGAGCFGLVFGQLLDCKLTSLDIISSHIQRCKVMMKSLGIMSNHITSDSVSFLKELMKSMI